MNKFYFNLYTNKSNKVNTKNIREEYKKSRAIFQTTRLKIILLQNNRSYHYL